MLQPLPLVAIMAKLSLNQAITKVGSEEHNWCELRMLHVPASLSLPSKGTGGFRIGQLRFKAKQLATQLPLRPWWGGG